MKGNDMEKQFMNLGEFLDNISRGGEVEFVYKGRAYFVGLTGTGEYTVYELHNYQSECCYSTPEEVCFYKIGNENLGDIIIKANITFRCFD